MVSMPPSLIERKPTAYFCNCSIISIRSSLAEAQSSQQAQAVKLAQVRAEIKMIMEDLRRKQQQEEQQQS